MRVDGPLSQWGIAGEEKMYRWSLDKAVQQII